MKGVAFTPLKRVPSALGDVMHALKNSDAQFCGFGEAYFTSVHYRAVKGWKRHKQMVLNLVVPVGRVRFVVYNGQGEHDDQNFTSVVLSPCDVETYGRLTISPGLWLAFEGLSENNNLILNVASIRHDPAEAENLPLQAIPWKWGHGAESLASGASAE